MAASPYKSWADALWRRIDQSDDDGCWLWTGPVTDDGYGRVSRFVDGKGRNQRAHRLAWTLVHGDPGDLHVLHHCDTPLCVRLDHLFLGTQADNMADRNQKGRQPRGESHGRARLSASEVRRIRQFIKYTTQQDVADIFGVSREHVRDIVARKKWAHV